MSMTAKELRDYCYQLKDIFKHQSNVDDFIKMTVAIDVVEKIINDYEQKEAEIEVTPEAPDYNAYAERAIAGALYDMGLVQDLSIVDESQGARKFIAFKMKKSDPINAIAELDSFKDCMSSLREIAKDYYYWNFSVNKAEALIDRDNGDLLFRALIFFKEKIYTYKDLEEMSTGSWANNKEIIIKQFQKGLIK